MNRQVFVINGSAARGRAMSAVATIPTGWRVEVKAPQRNTEQNARMWAMLTDVSRSKPGGRDLTTDQWKAVFLHAIGREVSFLPSLDGTTFIPWGQSSSDLSVSEMADLITFIQAWGDQNGVRWTEPERVAA